MRIHSYREATLVVCALVASIAGCSGAGIGDGPSDASGDTSTPGVHDAGTPDAATKDASPTADADPPDADPGIACTGASPGFVHDVQPIFQAHCGGEMCHNGTAGPTWPYAGLVNVKATRDTCASAGLLVSPGSLENSYLIHKLTGVGLCPTTSRMPSQGLVLPASDIQTIADWVCSGAKND